MGIKRTYSYRYLDKEGNIVLSENDVSLARIESEERLVNRDHYDVMIEERCNPTLDTCHTVYYFQPK